MAEPALQQPQPVHAALGPAGPLSPAVVSPHQLIGGHLSVPHQDQLIVPGEIGQHPVGGDAVPGQEGGGVIQPAIGAVVEVVDPQILEVARLAHRLEQSGAQLGVIVHGASGVHEEEDLHRVFPGALVADLQDPAVAGGVLDGAVHIEFGGRQVHQTGELAQVPQGHLELAGVQGVVPAEVPEFPLPRHPESPAVHALSPHPDPLGGQAGVAEHGHAVGAHPVTAPVVLLGLLRHPLLEHPLNLLLREAHIFQGLDLVPVGVVG